MGAGRLSWVGVLGIRKRHGRGVHAFFVVIIDLELELGHQLVAVELARPVRS